MIYGGDIQPYIKNIMPLSKTAWIKQNENPGIFLGQLFVDIIPQSAVLPHKFYFGIPETEWYVICFCYTNINIKH
jgi:hypothetical protein